MSKLKNIVIAIIGALLTILHISNKSKDRKIEKHKNEADKYKAEAEMQGYIAESERSAKEVKNRISHADERAIDIMLDKHNAYRD